MLKVLIFVLFSISMLLQSPPALAKSLETCLVTQPKNPTPRIEDDITKCPDTTVCTLQKAGKTECYSAVAAATGTGSSKECREELKCPPEKPLNPNTKQCEDPKTKVATNPVRAVHVDPCGGDPSLCASSIDPNSCKCEPAGATTCIPLSKLEEAQQKAFNFLLTGSKAIPCSIISGKPFDPGVQLPVNAGVYTAIGCVPSQPQDLVQGLLWYGTLAAGAIAFLLMIMASLQMITAEGNPEAIKQAQEKFYSAIIGLLLIVFSVLLMQIIGVDILGLKDFGR